MQDGTSDSIRLAFPATAEFSRIGRVGVSGLALRLGVPVQRVEQLRTAVDRCVELLEGCGQIVILARWEPGVLELEISREGFDLDDDTFARVSLELADLVDRIDARPNGLTFGLVDT
jgi:anti-sigma regulatory factor (Ser/Thr protein kinase)